MRTPLIPGCIALGRRTSIALAVGITFSLVLPSTAIADPLPDAEVLFQQGMRLLQRGQAEAACPKLAESHRLDPALGTQFYLAECYEAIGRTASAWFLFVDVADKASARSMLEQERKARARAAALAPRLCRLIIMVPGEVASLPGLQIQRDGVRIGKGAWDTAIPVDPGKHAVHVTAPGKQPWEAIGIIASLGATITVKVEPLKDAPASVPPRAVAHEPPDHPAEAPAPRASRGSAQRIAAGITGGLGLAGIGLGTAFGVMALNKNAEWKSSVARSCNAELDCRSDALRAIQGIEVDRDRFATLSTVAFIDGAALLTGAVILWASAPPAESKAEIAVQILPVV